MVMEVYGAKTLPGMRMTVCRLNSLSSFFLMFTLALSVPNRKPSGRMTRRASAGSQPVHDDGHEQIRRLAAGEVIREMVLHILLLAAAVGVGSSGSRQTDPSPCNQHIVQQAVVVEHLRYIGHRAAADW